MTISGLSADTTYYFAIKTSDEVPNESAISNIASVATLPGAPATCAAYCQGQGYSDGTCRANASQCNNNGETHESAGDAYCPGGGGSDTCCCAP